MVQTGLRMGNDKHLCYRKANKPCVLMSRPVAQARLRIDTDPAEKKRFRPKI